METKQLLKILASNANAKTLAGAMARSAAKTVRVGGLSGSSAALYIAALKQTRQSLPPILVVMNDMDEAGYFYHDMVQMLDEQSVLFFPSSYRRAIKYNQKDAANEILRTEVLSRLSADGDTPVIVTCPEAIAEKVVSKSEISESTILIRKGECMDTSELEKRLFALGFKHTDYVYEPGQFAIRGSIVDIYSYSSEVPFRIDFFGDEVDSIRSFDVQTQLSESKLDSATIVPELSTADTNFISFLDFLPEKTTLVMRNMNYMCERIEQIYDEGFSVQARALEMSEAADEASQEASLAELAKTMLALPDEFKRRIMDFRRVEMHVPVVAEEDAKLNFDTSPQPLFHKNFDLLDKELHRLLDEGYAITILADSPKQIDRLKDIFAELNEKKHKSGSAEIDLKFEPVTKTIHEGFIDHTLRQCFFTDHQIFDRFHKYNLKSDKARRGKVALTLKELSQFEIGDFVVHIDHGVGRFGGLVRVPERDGSEQEKIKITFLNDDTVYVSIHALHKVSKYKGKDGQPPRISKLGTGAWERMKDRVKSKVKDIARDLIKLYAQRRKEKGFAFSADNYMQHELEASFLYEDTPDQLKATQDIKADMERTQPMDRLVCGDVGFGKTEVAVRAAFKAACDGKQVAVLVPTTVLAYQHYKTFSSRLKDFPVKVDYLSRARDTKAVRALQADLAEGKTDIVIGTHKLIGKDVKFKDLGLLIIDEEQKFGVAVKEKLRQMKVNVDTLTMTATPIPRTLQFSLMGARDLSVIQTPPPNRYPIQTEVHTFSAEVIVEAINFEMSRNGQVFFVNNRINNLLDLEALIKRNIPDCRVCIGHGQMAPKELEKIVFDFMNHDYDVLLSTTIVENGVDVPNANTIIINSAHTYGLSDLHQMRGRVGRGNRKAFCYLLAPPMSGLNDEARRRLQAIENFSDLGSGLHIAMQDLDIRGAGNMLGAEQSGFVADLGYETYQKVLGEAVKELRESEFAELFKEQEQADESSMTTGYVTDCTLETDLQAFLPEEYVPNSGERMNLYRELDSLVNERQLDGFRKRLLDRFGAMPHEGEELLLVMPVKWLACKYGIEKVTLKQHRMMLYLVSDFSSPYYQSRAFEKVIHYASWHPRNCQLKEKDKRYLVVSNVNSVSDAHEVLKGIDEGNIGQN